MPWRLPNSQENTRSTLRIFSATAITMKSYIEIIWYYSTNKVIQINSMPDHIHILVGMTPDIALSDLMQSIKIGSTRFINRQDWIAGKFQWQEGFGAFSYSRSQLNTVAAYIENQEEHHSRQTFHEEYLEFLKRFNIPYDAKYVFDLEAPLESPRR